MDELDEIERVLRNASVSIYGVISSHIGWSGEDIKDFCLDRLSSKKGDEKELNKRQNTSGDKVLAMDELADNLIEEEFRQCELIAGFASEEREDFVVTNSQGKYVIVYDPLDGSQNIPVGLSVGAIFGVFKASHINQVKTGQEMVASGYAMFSTALQFAFCTVTTPVHVSQFDFENHSWVTFLKNFKQPRKGKTYAINEGNCANWDQTVSTFVAQHLRGRSVRWMCCMVADVSRQLLQGGCFLYPCDKKYPKGRLRLVYEAIPLAFMWERAGKGIAYANSDGDRILDIPMPKDMHARCGVIFLGEDETQSFNRVRSHASTWAGGKEKEKLKVEKNEKDKAIQSEMTLLRGALVVGAIFNIALLIRRNW